MYLQFKFIPSLLHLSLLTLCLVFFFKKTQIIIPYKSLLQFSLYPGQRDPKIIRRVIGNMSFLTINVNNIPYPTAFAISIKGSMTRNQLLFTRKIIITISTEIESYSQIIVLIPFRIESGCAGVRTVTLSRAIYGDFGKRIRES